MLFAQEPAGLIFGQLQLDQSPAVPVAISELSVTDSPRISGESHEHVQLLAESERELAPIIVHRPTMRVLDGVHRLRVAQLRGHDRIAARFFCGTEADAFALAVSSNIGHGLPLALSDRRAAAARIVRSHPIWSDRMIAAVTGLSPAAVARLRVGQDGQGGLSPEEGRLGRDGRVRPLNRVAKREHAAQLMIDNPGLSLREVARQVAISPETARDVRNRLRLGENPAPSRRKRSSMPRTGLEVKVVPHPGKSVVPEIRSTIAVQRLNADPALRFSEAARPFLRLINANTADPGEWEKIADGVPLHASRIAAFLARERAGMWQTLAERLEHRGTDLALLPKTWP